MTMPIRDLGPSKLNEDNATKLKRTQLAPEDFMTLMLAQLKMQDPLKPYDNSAMLQNMAQISSLNSTKDLQSTIKNMNANMGKSQVLAASQLVGKNVALASESSSLIEGQGLTGSVVLPSNAAQVMVSIRDAKDQEVRALALGPTGAGMQDFHWDGTDAAGKPMAPGAYHFVASADINGKPVAVGTAGIYKVNSVSLDPKDQEVILGVNGIGNAKMNDILKIL